MCFAERQVLLYFCFEIYWWLVSLKNTRRKKKQKEKCCKTRLDSVKYSSKWDLDGYSKCCWIHRSERCLVIREVRGSDLCNDIWEQTGVCDSPGCSPVKKTKKKTRTLHHRHFFTTSTLPPPTEETRTRFHFHSVLFFTSGRSFSVGERFVSAETQ